VPTRRTREESKRATRESLLAAAAEVFAAKGFVGASLEEIADRAGFTKGAVYSNFGSKEELVLAVLDERLNDRLMNIVGLVDANAPADEQLRSAAQLVGKAFAEERSWFLLWLEFSAYVARNPRYRPKFAARERQLRDAMAELIRQRADAVGLAPALPPDELATALFALGDGLTLATLRDPEGVPEELFGAVLAVLLVPQRSAARTSRAARSPEETAPSM
jgi:AcrR family transcriptional regulator